MFKNNISWMCMISRHCFTSLIVWWLWAPEGRVLKLFILFCTFQCFQVTLTRPHAFPLIFSLLLRLELSPWINEESGGKKSILLYILLQITCILNLSISPKDMNSCISHSCFQYAIQIFKLIQYLVVHSLENLCNSGLFLHLIKHTYNPQNTVMKICTEIHFLLIIHIRYIVVLEKEITCIS